MAKQYEILTSASPTQVESAFREVFFTRPKFLSRFNPSKSAQLQSNLKWKMTAEQTAVVAAELESGGLREAVADSKRGTGTIVGMRIAMAIDGRGEATTAQLWLANYATYIGFNTVGDILKSYTKQVARKLSEQGASAEVRKV